MHGASENNACRLVLHSVSYAGVWTGQARLTVEEFIDRAAALGFDGVMLMAKRPHASPLDLDPAARAAIRDRLERHGLHMSCLACYTNFTADWQHAGTPQPEIQVVYGAELARLTRDLGGDVMRVFTAYDVPGVAYRAVWDRCVRCLKELAQRAAEFGVTLAVQNHHDVANHYESLHDLLVEVDEPNCRAAFDAWAPALQGDDLVVAAKKLAPWTVHTTVADYQRRPRFAHDLSNEGFEPRRETIVAVPPGEGVVDNATFIRALIQAGFRGSIAYEMCWPLIGGGSLENLDRVAGKFLQMGRALVAGTAGAQARATG